MFANRNMSGSLKLNMCFENKTRSNSTVICYLKATRFLDVVGIVLRIRAVLLYMPLKPIFPVKCNVTFHVL